MREYFIFLSIINPNKIFTIWVEISVNCECQCIFEIKTAQSFIPICRTSNTLYLRAPPAVETLVFPSFCCGHQLGLFSELCVSHSHLSLPFISALLYFFAPFCGLIVWA